MRGACCAQSDGLGETLELIALSAVDNVACDWGSREDLVLALRSEDAFEVFSEEQGISRRKRRTPSRTAWCKPSTMRDRAGHLPGVIAPLVRQAAESVTPWLILEALERLRELPPG